MGQSPASGMENITTVDHLSIDLESRYSIFRVSIYRELVFPLETLLYHLLLPQQLDRGPQILGQPVDVVASCLSGIAIDQDL